MNPGMPHIDIERWVRCEREALEGPDSGRGPAHVGAVVAQQMHRLLDEEPPSDDLDLGDVRYDSVTGRTQDISRVATLMAEEVSRLKVIYELGPPDHVVRVVTGKRIGTAWLALGRTLCESPDDDILYATIIHVPRVPLGRESAGSVHSRPAIDLALAWRSREQRLNAVLDGFARPLPSPGEHCARCRLDCVVRARG